MPERTDEVIKRKHNEFNKRIKSVLEEVRGGSSIMEKLREAINRQKQMQGM